LRKGDQESEKLFRETIEDERSVFGPEHPTTLLAMSNLSEVLRDQHNYSEAEKLQRQAISIQRRVLGPSHPNVADSTYNLGCLAALQNRRDEAFSLIRLAIDSGLSSDTNLKIGQDPNLTSLHGDARFDALVARANQRASSEKKTK
jgi:tetratricopeptide (TPR) repeat protein